MEIEILASVAKVQLNLKPDKGQVIRRIDLILEREFDDTIAAALGDGARKALDSLRKNELISAEIAIDAIDVTAEFVNNISGEVVQIGALRGDKAKCLAAKEEDGGTPVIQLKMSCAYSRDVWVFFGEHGGLIVAAAFRDRQLELVPSPTKAHA